MGKLETIEKIVNIAKVVVDGGIALATARKKKSEDEKDRKIRELEAENKRLKEGGT